MKTSKEMQLKIIDKMRENVESGKPFYQGLEWRDYYGDWVEDGGLVDLDDHEYRLKPETITINGVEILKPLSKEQVAELTREKMLYIVSDNHKSFNTLNVGNVLAFGNRFVYETKEQAIEASKALFGIEG